MNIPFELVPLRKCASRRPCAYFLVASLLLVGSVRAQGTEAAATRPSALAGLVRGETNLPLPFVTVVADGADRSDVTDSTGRFFVGGLKAGVTEFTISRIGYRQLRFSVTLPRDTTIVISVRLTQVVVLTPVTATARATITGLKRSGYYDRQRYGIGSFVSPERIDSLAPTLMHAAQLLRDVSGLAVQCSAGGCAVTTRRAHRCLLLFVDGALMPGNPQIDAVVPLSEVGAIEVYANPTTVPAEFQGTLPRKTSTFTQKAGCGALVVWTRVRLMR